MWSQQKFQRVAARQQCMWEPSNSDTTWRSLHEKWHCCEQMLSMSSKVDRTVDLAHQNKDGIGSPVEKLGQEAQRDSNEQQVHPTGGKQSKDGLDILQGRNHPCNRQGRDHPCNRLPAMKNLHKRRSRCTKGLHNATKLAAGRMQTARRTSSGPGNCQTVSKLLSLPQMYLDVGCRRHGPESRSPRSQLLSHS